MGRCYPFTAPVPNRYLRITACSGHDLRFYLSLLTVDIEPAIAALGEHYRPDEAAEIERVVPESGYRSNGERDTTAVADALDHALG